MLATHSPITNLACRTIDVDGVAALVGRSATSVYRDDDAGRVPKSIRIGQSRRWLIAEIEAWLLHGCPPRAEWAAIWAELRRERSIGGLIPAA